MDRVAEKMKVGAPGTLAKLLAMLASWPHATTGLTWARPGPTMLPETAALPSAAAVPPAGVAVAAREAPGSAAPTTPMVATATAAARGTTLRSRPVRVPHIPTTSPFTKLPPGPGAACSQHAERAHGRHQPGVICSACRGRQP